MFFLKHGVVVIILSIAIGLVRIKAIWNLASHQLGHSVSWMYSCRMLCKCINDCKFILSTQNSAAFLWMQ